MVDEVGESTKGLESRVCRPWIIFWVQGESIGEFKAENNMIYLFLKISIPKIENAAAAAAAAAAKSLQPCPRLYDSADGNPPASSVHGILQASTLE